MKFWTDTKEKGEKVKHYIRDLAKGDTPVALSDVMEGFGHLPDPSTFNMIFDSHELLKKMRLRELKSGWFLYLPEPYESKDLVIPQDAIKVLNDYIYGRPCYVTNKRKKEPGWSHGKSDLKFTKADGTEIAYPIFVVEMYDGTVRQVKPENIIFTDR